MVHGIEQKNNQCHALFCGLADLMKKKWRKGNFLWKKKRDVQLINQSPTVALLTKKNVICSLFRKLWIHKRSLNYISNIKYLSHVKRTGLTLHF